MMKKRLISGLLTVVLVAGLLAGCGAFEDEPPAPEALLAAWEADSAAFARRKAAYHLYK